MRWSRRRLRSVTDVPPADVLPPFDQLTGRSVLLLRSSYNFDRAKRPIMGRIADELADVPIVTSDNPRSEDPEAIIDEIVGGGSGFVREADRRRAISLAVERAGEGDVVLIAGKGHEQGQEFEDGRKEPFDDVTVAREVLRGARVNA